ncbi:MAG: DUF5110 domain-containing protein [Alistipes sp.]|nr:DUF5110 domain-containing protein [Candidatus Alistipes equi]
MKRILTLIIIIGFVLTTNASTNNPKANDDACVVCGKARFTMLTPKLLRMEWSENGQFEDRASLTFINRNTNVPPFKVKKSKNQVVITTSHLKLVYKGQEKFNEKNLNVEYVLDGEKRQWYYGLKDTLNLKGTTRTLDRCKGWTLGKEPMEDGIISRSGVVCVDDSKNFLFEKSDSHWGTWVEKRNEGEKMDLYLFAYGHNYKEALSHFTLIAGKIPLPPRYVFGYWWSRYWQYSDNEFKDLVNTFKSYNIPIDVLIIDMDWHETWNLRRRNAPRDRYGERRGWTGYTWKSQLFPSPENFLKWCHDQNLKTSLNIHPASGIEPYEEPYQRFCDAYGFTQKDGRRDYTYRKESTYEDYEAYCKKMGLDPLQGGVPFRIDDMKWADAYFNTVLGPFEKQGIDFWWLDWQQWRESKYLKGLSNTFWLNHTFFLHMAQKSEERPLIYHRWGGLGSHRYQVGFSGDTFSTWDTLSFLPWFTSTASNVGYGYWGHDIGGHLYEQTKKKTDAELYLRWLQYGVFTPIFKTHCTKNRFIERRIWMFSQHQNFMRDAIRLRYTLSPYIYGAAREAFDTGISICRPMYYEYPENEEAYSYKEQHFFGNDMIVSAITAPVNACGIAKRKMWLPKGVWYDYFTGSILDGNCCKEMEYTLNELPMIVRAGAIIAQSMPQISDLQHEQSSYILEFIPAADGRAILYEDNGVSNDYETKYATTKISQKRTSKSIDILIEARQGEYQGAKTKRNFILRLPCTMPAKRITVNGKEIPYARYATQLASWNYDGYSLSNEIHLQEHLVKESQAVHIEFVNDVKEDERHLSALKGVFMRARELTPLFKETFAQSYDPLAMLPDEYLNVARTPSSLTEEPENAELYLRKYNDAKKIMIPSLEEKKCVDSDFLKKIDAQLNRIATN